MNSLHNLCPMQYTDEKECLGKLGNKAIDDEPHHPMASHLVTQGSIDSSATNAQSLASSHQAHRPSVLLSKSWESQCPMMKMPIMLTIITLTRCDHLSVRLSQALLLKSWMMWCNLLLQHLMSSELNLCWPELYHITLEKNLCQPGYRLQGQRPMLSMCSS